MADVVEARKRAKELVALLDEDEDEATPEEIAAIDAEIEEWETFLRIRCDEAGPATALSAFWTVADMMKAELLPREN
jgi:hypothetical protein